MLAAIDCVLAAVDTFYGEVLQHLKAWTAAPPRMREPADLPTEQPSGLSSTALSSQDGTEVVPVKVPTPGASEPMGDPGAESIEDDEIAV